MTWYSNGTVDTTANSAVVRGTNTWWMSSGLRAGDMLLIGYSTASPRGYEIKSIDNDVQITLVMPFPVAASGAPYVGIPMLSGDRTAITMTLATQISKAFTDNQAMAAVWQAFYTGNGTVTLTMPDGTKVTGSSFQKLTADMAGKASNSDPRLNSIDGKTAGTVRGIASFESEVFYINSPNPSSNWNTGIVFRAGQGNNLAYSGVYSENTGDITLATALAGSPRYFTHTRSGNFGCSGTVTCSSVIQTSDKDKKDDIKTISDALAKINTIRGATFIWKDTGLPSAGVIAQELKEVLPEAIGTVFDDHDEYGEVDQEVEHEVEGENGEITTVKEIVKTRQIVRKRDDSKRSYSVEYSAVIALAVQGINELSEKVRSLEAEVASLKPEQAS